MAVAVASHSPMVASNYPTDSVVVTAPTGITTGDLLVILVGGKGIGSPTGSPLENYNQNSGVATCTGFTEGYYHSYDYVANSTAGGEARFNALWKIAVLADESATDYTVQHNSLDYGGAAIMFRITGWPGGNPFGHGHNAYATFTPAIDENLDASTTTLRPAQQVMIMYCVSETEGIFTFDYSGQSSTPSYTWTEAGEIDYTTSVANDSGAFMVAYATSADTTNLVQFDVYKDRNGTGGNEVAILGVIQIFDAVGDSGTTALYSAPNANFFTNAGVFDVIGSHARIDANATFPAVTAVGSEPTVWTLTLKP